MQPITTQLAVRVRNDYTPLRVYPGCVWVVIYVTYITSTNNIVLGNLRYHRYKPIRS